MMIRDIERRIEGIRKAACMDNDDEEAHRQEDELYYDFIKTIADGTFEPMAQLQDESKAYLQRSAQLILTIKDIEFARWTS